MDNCFRRFAEVEVSENWSIPNKSWNEIGSTDMCERAGKVMCRKVLKEMIAFGEKAEKALANAPQPCKICVSMNLQNGKNYFEKLPLLSLILKRVVKEYPSVVFTLYRMSCQNNVVNCVVEFSETKDWVIIINSYESNILVWEYKEGNDCLADPQQQVMLDI